MKDIIQEPRVTIVRRPKREKSVGVSLTAAEYATVQRLADSESVSMATWLRRRALLTIDGKDGSDRNNAIEEPVA